MARELSRMKTLGWSPYLGKREGLVYFNLLGRNIRVRDFWVPAVEAMQVVLVATGYENPMDNTGSFYPRYIAGTTIWSAHSYGACVDIDYGGNNPDSPWHPGSDRNPHVHERLPKGFGTDPRIQITEAQAEAITNIRTNNGKQVWYWLGWSIGDSMHFEQRCSPDDIKTGIDWSTVVGAEGGPPPSASPIPNKEDEQMLSRGDKGEGVADIQADLIAQGKDLGAFPPYRAGYPSGADGDFGASTETAVKEVQGAKGLSPTGKVDGLTAHFISGSGSSSGVPGPRGPAGPAGPQGPKGDTGSVEVFVDGEKVS